MRPNRIIILSLIAIINRRFKNKNDSERNFTTIFKYIFGKTKQKKLNWNVLKNILLNFKTIRFSKFQTYVVENL